MLARVAWAILAGVVAALITFLVLGLLSVPTEPWSGLIGILVAIVVFLQGDRL